jgi:hypothetical protein
MHQKVVWTGRGSPPLKVDLTLIEYLLDLTVEERLAINRRNARFLAAAREAAAQQNKQSQKKETREPCFAKTSPNACSF